MRISFEPTRLFARLARRVRERLRGETAATFFDPFSRHDLTRLLAEFDIPGLRPRSRGLRTAGRRPRGLPTRAHTGPARPIRRLATPLWPGRIRPDRRRDSGLPVRARRGSLVRSGRYLPAEPGVAAGRAGRVNRIRLESTQNMAREALPDPRGALASPRFTSRPVPNIRVIRCIAYHQSPRPLQI